jgi:hypothetical protein
MRIEIKIIHEYQLETYLNQGYEFVCAVTESHVDTYSVPEEVPVQQTFVSNNSTQHIQPTYINKQYPVTRIDTRLVIKRTQAAKLLYEKSLKNENNT